MQLGTDLNTQSNSSMKVQPQRHEPTTRQKQLTELICKRLEDSKADLIEQYRKQDTIFTPHAYLDDLLPQDICTQINQSFPDLKLMKFAANFREQKHVTRSAELIKDLTADITFALQDERILEILTEITGISDLISDPYLYGSGLSSMVKGDYLNPHLDNSHDQNKENKRVLNLLYYVSPDWIQEYGGNLELWDRKIKNKNEIVSKFNRLVIMETNKHSFHAVNPVVVDKRRNCVSNYYFVKCSGKDFHISTFKARPGNHLDALKINLDTALRKSIRMFFDKGVFTPDTFERGSAGGFKRKVGEFIRDTFLYKKDGK